MAKGARSNSKKAVRAQRRAQAQPEWKDKADAARYATLAAAAVSQPIGAVRDDGQQAEVPAQRPAAMQTDLPKAKAAKRRKGINVGRVQKRTHNKKKVSALWTSNFHNSKKGKKGLQ